MPITQGESITVGVIEADHVILDLPVNTTEDLLIVIVTGGASSGSAPTFTISGWTSIVTSVNGFSPYEIRIAAFYHAGGLIAPIDIVAGLICDQLNAAAFVLQGTAPSSPIAGTNSGSGTASSFSLSCTTSVVDEFVFTAFAGTFGVVGGGVGMANELFHGDGSSTLLSVATGLVGGIRHAVGSASASGAFVPAQSGIYASIAFGIKPFLGPTDAAVVFPNGVESLVAGAVVALRCTAASSPSASPSTLQYEFSNSTDNGGSWTVIGLSPAGVTSKTWTVPATLGNTNLIRVRSYDPAIITYSLGYDQSDAAFSTVAETTPTVAITSPPVGSVQIKSAALPIAWSYSGGTGNPQTQFTLQWSRDYFVSHTAIVGPVGQAGQSYAINVSGEADGAIISVRVKAQGLSIPSAYSPIVSFTIASVPSAPNITAPTAGSPPTAANPTETITSTSAFVARSMRTIQGGTEIQNNIVESNTLSYIRPYSYANGVTVTIYVAVRNQYGLWSTEDSETVTPAYTGPTQPTVVYTPNSEGGYIRATITNSGTITKNEVWRRENGQAKSLAIRISPSTSTAFLPANGQFDDYAVLSELGYVYFVRTYNGPVYTDSADSSPQAITLTDIWLHAASRTNATNNVLGVPVHMVNLISSGGHGFEETETTVDLLGRDEPGAIFGQAIWERLAVQTFFRFTEQAQYDALLALVDAQASGAVLLIRNSLGDRFYCQIADLGTSIKDEGYDIDYSAEEVDYSEAI